MLILKELWRFLLITFNIESVDFTKQMFKVILEFQQDLFLIKFGSLFKNCLEVLHTSMLGLAILNESAKHLILQYLDKILKLRFMLEINSISFHSRVAPSSKKLLQYEANGFHMMLELFHCCLLHLKVFSFILLLSIRVFFLDQILVCYQYLCSHCLFLSNFEWNFPKTHSAVLILVMTFILLGWANNS